jgi:hypothetical protein
MLTHVHLIGQMIAIVSVRQDENIRQRIEAKSMIVLPVNWANM